ncbi:MAG: ATP-binding protein [Sphingosinicella sp.]|uniref:ATP-binding protein n=1 Tax=Sphingosinicella sp. TaxID=1917971 RepID=UPI004037716E
MAKNEKDTAEESSQAVPELDLFTRITEQLKEEKGGPVALPSEPDDIGGELISILSKGLYTNPLDCLREYAQNGVDARATTITIKITGNTVMIFDDGAGMGLADLLEAKKFGLSPKSISEHVGFRGIGIYSGFDLCRQLVIKSTCVGDTSIYVLSFAFAAMKAQLDKERQQTGATERTSLLDLLTKHTTVARREGEAVLDEHYTSVELRDIQPEHIALLSDRVRLREYLLQNLPIAFAPSFSHGAAIDTKLRTHVPGYSPIVVKLQLAGQREEIVQKYGPSPAQIAERAEAEKARNEGDAALPTLSLNLRLGDPEFRTISNKTGQQIGFYWACLNKERGRLEPSATTPQYEGFIYKVKGFSIGDRNKLRGRFPRPQLYPWFTGEVYVIDPNVVPNAERNDFETSTAKQTLEFALQEDFRIYLKPLAETFQAQEKAADAIKKQADQLAALERDFSAPAGSETILHEDLLDRITSVSNMIDDLKKRKRAAKPEDAQRADALTVRAKSLKQSLVKLVQNPGSEVSKRRREANTERTESPAGGGDPEAATKILTLDEVFASAGWDIDPGRAELVSIMQSAIEDLFGSGSPDYQRFIAYVADRLNEATDLP